MSRRKRNWQHSKLISSAVCESEYDRDLTELPDPTDAVNNISLRLDIGEALDPLDQVIDDQFADAGKVVGILFDAFAAEQEKIGKALTAITSIPEFARSYNSAAETTRSIGDSARRNHRSDPQHGRLGRRGLDDAQRMDC